MSLKPESLVISNDSKRRQREADEAARLAKTEAEKALTKLKLITEESYAITKEIDTSEDLETATIYMFERRQLEREV